jgi:ribosomal protein S18 acetylase RimI-like enzyme
MYLLKKSLHSNLKKISTCHQVCFQDSFSVKLGDAYVLKSFEWFLAADNRFLHHVEDEDENVIGYCGGFISRQKGDGSTSGMMQYGMKQAAIGIIKKPWLFFNAELRQFYPLVIKNIFRKFFSAKKKLTENFIGDETFEKKTGLVVIGINPDYQGKGAFEILMKNFEKESLNRKINKLSLSVKITNRRAINAYKKAGWQTADENAKALLMHKIITENNE